MLPTSLRFNNKVTNFHFQDSNLKFRPGDTIGVLPQNTATEVDFLLEHLELTSKADVQYELTVDKAVKGAKIPPHIPVQSSLRHVLTHCVDVRGVVKKVRYACYMFSLG